MLAWYGSETYAIPMAISPSKSNAPITFNIFFIFFIFCAKVMHFLYCVGQLPKQNHCTTAFPYPTFGTWLSFPEYSSITDL